MSVEKKIGNIEIVKKVTPRRGLQFKYTWKIEKFNYSSGSKYESPIFSPLSSGKIAFYLKLSKGASRPMLCTLPCQIPDTTLILTVSLLCGKSGPMKTMAKTIRTSRPEIYKIQCSTSVREFPLLVEFMEKKGDYIYDRHLDEAHYSTASLELTFNFEMIFDGYSSFKTPIVEPLESKLLSNLEKLVDNHEYSDVIFEVCEQEIPAHKTILSMNSPVFAMMFKHEMQEKLQNRVSVTDIEANVFTQMLRYIYTGKVQSIEIFADKLLAAAEKYELEGLKLMCQESLSKTLTVKTAADTLVLADRYDAIFLKVQTAEFINLNIRKVLDTEGFHEMTESSPMLMTEILRASVGSLTDN